jgi:hypothetical protein
MSKRVNLTGKLFGSLRVRAEAETSKHNKRIWLTECLRPIHKGEIATRLVPTGELTRPDGAVACLECAVEDRRTNSRAARDAKQGPKVVEPKGCAELMCSDLWHSPNCQLVNLRPVTKYSAQRDLGDGIYPRTTA